MNHYYERASLPERVWVGKDAIGGLLIYPRPPEHRQAAQYMRVLMRHEVDRLAGGEGVEIQQFLNHMNRTIEGQRRHIARLLARPTHDELRHALATLLGRYVDLACSGDCGFWNPEEEAAVIDARRVLAETDDPELRDKTPPRR